MNMGVDMVIKVKSTVFGEGNPIPKRKIQPWF